MNIKHILSASAAVALLAACSDYDPGKAPETRYTAEEEQLLSSYEAGFIAQYGENGQIDEDHSWGFGEQGSVDEATAAKARATRGSQPNGNLWEDMGYTIPDLITDAERAAVVQAFRTHTQSDTQPNLSTFFVQQVYKGGLNYNLIDGLTVADYTYPDADGGTVVSSDCMDLLKCGVARTGSQLWNEWDDGYDHVFDFNYGNSTDYNGCMLMTESATTDFYYHSSKSNENRHEYICLTVTWQENGQTHSGCYVGFDYLCTGENGNQKVARDWKFDDWIVKIVPAEPSDDPDDPDDPDDDPIWRRIMCEDLGNTHDFDFNDLVFDVFFTGTAGNYVANIRVQAAGGTLPIYIGFDGNSAYEAHKILGQTVTNKAVNAGKGTVQAGFRDITINMKDLGLGNSTDANDIPIYVTHTSASGVAKTTLLPASGKGESKAPQKICIPGSDTAWSLEDVDIQKGYPHFRQWVQDEFSTYGFDSATPWNTTDLQPAYLYFK